MLHPNAKKFSKLSSVSLEKCFSSKIVSCSLSEVDVEIDVDDVDIDIFSLHPTSKNGIN